MALAKGRWAVARGPPVHPLIYRVDDWLPLEAVDAVVVRGVLVVL